MLVSLKTDFFKSRVQQRKHTIRSLVYREALRYFHQACYLLAYDCHFGLSIFKSIQMWTFIKVVLAPNVVSEHLVCFVVRFIDFFVVVASLLLCCLYSSLFYTHLSVALGQRHKVKIYQTHHIAISEYCSVKMRRTSRIAAVFLFWHEISIKTILGSSKWLKVCLCFPWDCCPRAT